jgi:hypothetical protein
MYSKKHIKKLLTIVHEKKFLVPAGFASRSHNWVRKQYNGVGAEWMPRFIRGFMTWVFEKIEAAALVHDCEFGFKEKSYYRFTIANLRLAANGAKQGHPFLGGVCALLCQIFGWSAYRDGKESMSYCNYYKEN